MKFAVIVVMAFILLVPITAFGYELDETDRRVCKSLASADVTLERYATFEQAYQACLDEAMEDGLSRERPRQAVILFFVLLIVGSIVFFALKGRKKKSGTITQEYDRLTSQPTLPKEPEDFLPKSNSSNEIIVQHPSQANYNMYSHEAWDENFIKPHKFKVEILEPHRNLNPEKNELWIIPIESGNAIEIHQQNNRLYIPIVTIHQDKWDPDFNSNICEIPYFDVPLSKWEKIDEDDEESTKIIDSHTHYLKIKLNNSDKEKFYKTLQAYRIKEYDEMYWETREHDGVSIPYKTPFLAPDEQLVISNEDPQYNAITVVTNHRVFRYDFDRSVMDGYLLWSNQSSVSVVNRHTVSQSVSSGSIIGTKAGGMRVGTFGGISSGTSRSVGDLLFNDAGTTYVRINGIAGVTGMAQHIKTIIKKY